jgi:NAD(P)-dependent dehydrogenase (short-subunit alcohol dehydrogenase family)
MSSIIQSTGEIDILVACATSLQLDNLTKDTPTEDFAESFTVNVVGLLHLVKEFLALPSTKASGSRKTVVHID